MLIKWKLCEETELANETFSTLVEDNSIISFIHDMKNQGVEEKDIEGEVFDWIWQKVDEDFCTRISANIMEEDMKEKVSKLLKEMAA